MLVAKSVEGPANLFVNEPVWPVESGDPTRKAPRYPKMPGTPGDLVARAQEVGGNAADCAFARVSHRRNVRGHRKRQIEGLGRRHGELRYALKPNRHRAMITRSSPFRGDARTRSPSRRGPAVGRMLTLS